MTATDIQNGHAFCKAAMEVHADLLMTLIKGIDYCSEMKEQKKELTEVGKAGMDRIDSLLNHERVLKVMRRRETPISDAEACLLEKWGYLVCYPNYSVMQFAAYAEVQVLLDDMLAGGWFA